MHSFRASIVKFLDIDPMIVGPGIKTGLNIRMDNPQNMGADCIADCAGAYYEYAGRFWWRISARPPRSTTSPRTRR